MHVPLHAARTFARSSVQLPADLAGREFTDITASKQRVIKAVKLWTDDSPQYRDCASNWLLMRSWDFGSSSPRYDEVGPRRAIYITVLLAASVSFNRELRSALRWSRDGRRSGRPAPVAGRVGSTLGDRCVTDRSHKMQNTFFKYKPKTESHWFTAKWSLFS